MLGAALVGIGLHEVITHPRPLRRILGFNLLGGGIFLVFGVVARRGAGAGFGGDPVPQAMVITGLVVAFAATALAVALLLRLAGAADRQPADPAAGAPAPGATPGAPHAAGPSPGPSPGPLPGAPSGPSSGAVPAGDPGMRRGLSPGARPIPPPIPPLIPPRGERPAPDTA
nr:NADH-quinone oxidoreductase subunit K [Roseomonas acroporae]